MSERACVDCGVSGEPLWNGGRCWDCHDARCLFPIGDGSSPLAPAGFDPMAAGERWDEDDPW